MIALAARFYGWSWQELRETPYRTLKRFVEYIPELQAREKLTGATVATMPHMTDKDRKRIHQGWLYEANIEPAKPHTIKGADVKAFIGVKPKIKQKDPKK